MKQAAKTNCHYFKLYNFEIINIHDNFKSWKCIKCARLVSEMRITQTKMTVKQGKENNFQVSNTMLGGNQACVFAFRRALQSQEVCVPFYKSMTELL